MEPRPLFDYDKAGWQRRPQCDWAARGNKGVMLAYVNQHGIITYVEQGVPSYYLPGPVEPIGNMTPPDPKKVWAY